MEAQAPGAVSQPTLSSPCDPEPQLPGRTPKYLYLLNPSHYGHATLGFCGQTPRMAFLHWLIPVSLYSFFLENIPTRPSFSHLTETPHQKWTLADHWWTGFTLLSPVTESQSPSDLATEAGNTLLLSFHFTSPKLHCPNFSHFLQLFFPCPFFPYFLALLLSNDGVPPASVLRHLFHLFLGFISIWASNRHLNLPTLGF